MKTILLVVALAVGGFAVSKLRFVQQLNSRAFMPVVYAGAAIFFAIRAGHALIAHSRAWPHVLLAGLFLAGALSSARASGVLKRT
jgi:hypothetical protein